ncbi:MAG: hypothetical protein HY465_02830 [Deltaproteobacteria bacterium]|nr:hypothetical protein [Deltaproteobacteria bacterium]
MRRVGTIIIVGALMIVPRISRGENRLPLGWSVTPSEHQTRLVFHPPSHLRESHVLLRLVSLAEWEAIREAPSELLGGRKVLRVEGENGVSFFFEEASEHYVLNCHAPAVILLDVAIACREIMAHFSAPLPTSEQETLQKVFEGGAHCAPHQWRRLQELRTHSLALASAEEFEQPGRQAAWRAWRLEQQGRLDLARTWYEAAYEQEADPSVAAKIVILALKQGSRRVAKRWLKRTDPDSRLGAFARLEFFSVEEKTFEVGTLYERFEQAWCGELGLRAAYLAGRAAFAVGDDERGEQLFRRTLERDPGYLPTYREWLKLAMSQEDGRRTVIAELMTWLHKATPSDETRELGGLLRAAFRQSS